MAHKELTFWYERVLWLNICYVYGKILKNQFINKIRSICPCQIRIAEPLPCSLQILCDPIHTCNISHSVTTAVSFGIVSCAYIACSRVLWIFGSWWRHQMEAFPRYWSFVRGIHRSPVNSPHKGQWRRALMFFYLRLNKRLIKQWIRWWFETPSCPLWRHCNVLIVADRHGVETHRIQVLGLVEFLWTFAPIQ